MTERKSSWDKLVEKSTYHFDSKKVDTKDDVVTSIGHIEPTWHNELQ